MNCLEASHLGCFEGSKAAYRIPPQSSSIGSLMKEQDHLSLSWRGLLEVRLLNSPLLMFRLQRWTVLPVVRSFTSGGPLGYPTGK